MLALSCDLLIVVLLAVHSTLQKWWCSEFFSCGQETTLQAWQRCKSRWQGQTDVKVLQYQPAGSAVTLLVGDSSPTAGGEFSPT
jgi:hypothetical protein